MSTKITTDLFAVTATKLNVLISIIMLFTSGVTPEFSSLTVFLTSLSCFLVQFARILFNLTECFGRQLLSDYFTVARLNYLTFWSTSQTTSDIQSTFVFIICHVIGVVMPCVWHYGSMFPITVDNCMAFVTVYYMVRQPVCIVFHMWQLQYVVWQFVTTAI